MMKMKLFVLGLLTGALALAASDAGTYHLLKKISLTGEDNWDYLAIDQNGRRLYVSHGSQVEVIDLDKDEPVGKITGMNGVHGIAIASKLNRGFITSGNTSTVKVFDLKTLESLADIPAGNGPDGVIFEPVTQRVFAFNHRGGTLTVIDAVARKTIENIELGGQPEFPVTDGKGTVWINNEDKSMLLRIDAKTMKILDRWPTCRSRKLDLRALGSRTRFSDPAHAACEVLRRAVINTDPDIDGGRLLSVSRSPGSARTASEKQPIQRIANKEFIAVTQLDSGARFRRHAVRTDDGARRPPGSRRSARLLVLGRAVALAFPSAIQGACDSDDNSPRIFGGGDTSQLH